MLSVQRFSQAGLAHDNEDSYAVQPHPLDPDHWLCFVADGQGGRAGGGLASRLACEVGLNAAIACRPERLNGSSFWMTIIGSADHAVRDDPEAGFTTLVGLGISGTRIAGASNGDSAALLVCGERTVELTSGQHKNPPIGSGAASIVPFAAEMDAPWKVLVMSDGVWKYVGWGRVVEAARSESGAELVAALQRAARLPASGGFQDDFTVVVLEGNPSPDRVQ